MARSSGSGPYATLASPNKLTKGLVAANLAIPTRPSSGAGNVAFGGRSLTVVAGAASSVNAYPGLVVRSNGRFVACYRSATNDNPVADANIKFIYSDDLGLTWSTPVTIVAADSDGLHDLRDCMMSQLADGTLFVQFFKRLLTGLSATVYVTKSTDGGTTWSTPVAVGFSFGYGTFCSSPVVELANGNLLASAYGLDNSGDVFYTARVMKSTDSGATWGSEVTIADGMAASKQFTEPNLTLLANGTLLCLVRMDTTTKSIYSSTSADSGATWTAAALVFTGSGRPATIQLASGAVLIVNRRSDGTNSDRGLCYHTSWDNGATWGTEIVVETPANQALYAAPREVAPGVIAVLFGSGAANANASLKLRYLLDGYGRSPLGDLTRLANLTSVAAAYTMTNGDEVVLANGTFTVTLPPVLAGLRVVIKNTGTGVITISPASGTIDGAASLALANQYDGAEMFCDGTNWFRASQTLPIASAGQMLTAFAGNTALSLTGTYQSAPNSRTPISTTQLPAVSGKTLKVRALVSMSGLTAADSVDVRMNDDTGGVVLSATNFAAAGGSEWMVTPYVNAPSAVVGYWIAVRNNTASRGTLIKAIFQTQYV